LKAVRESLGYNQRDFAKKIGVPAPTLSRVESGQLPASPNLLQGVACQFPEVDIREVLCGEPTTKSRWVAAQEVAALVRPVIRALGQGLGDIPPEAAVADDYLAVPLLEGRVAAGSGMVVWEDVRSLVWVYRPELGRRRNLVAIQVVGDSMVPTIPPGAIIIIDKDVRRPRGRRRRIWALRTEDGDIQVKRLHRAKTGDGLIIISDNFEFYPPEPAWTNDLEKLVVGQVVWMWRSMAKP